MGCGSSAPKGNSPPARRTPRPNPPRPSGVPLGEPQGNNANTMRRNVRRQCLQVIHESLHDVPYMIIGGSALAEHGSQRETADVDVLIGGGCSKRSAEDLLISRSAGRLVRLGQGKLRYISPSGESYQLDLSTDVDVDLSFDPKHDTVVKGGARVGTVVFLLNSKAHAWQTRVPFEQNYRQKLANDAQDINFCLSLLKGQQQIDRRQLRWVYSRSFWTPFLTAYPRAEGLFRGAGLWTDSTSFTSDSSSAGGRSTLRGGSSFGGGSSGGAGGRHSQHDSHTGSRAGSRAGSQTGSRAGSQGSSRHR